MLTHSIDSIRFTCQVPPSVNSAYWLKVIYVGGKPVPQKVLTDDARRFKAQTVKAIERAMKRLNIKYLSADKNHYINLEVDMHIPKKRRDADNQFKLLQDAIVESGLVYDDAIMIPKVNNIVIDKYYPRLEVKVSIADKIGIFESKQQLEQFKNNNCEDCKRSKRNCSIMKTMLENKIVEEVKYPIKNNSICNKRKPVS